MPGQNYLKNLLSSKLNRVCTILRDVDLEINPTKVYAELVHKPGNKHIAENLTPEQAAALPEVENTIIPRIEALKEIAQDFLNAIIASLDSVPYGIRWICKQIRSLARVTLLPGCSRA